MSETMDSKMRRFSPSEGSAAYRRSSAIAACTLSHSDSALIFASASRAYEQAFYSSTTRRSCMHICAGCTDDSWGEGVRHSY